VRSILLVEDDDNAREVLAAILAKKFPDVALYTAGNGKAGLDLFKGRASDIVITDANMPEMNGAQMVDEIRMIKPDAKIIVITADNVNADLEHAAGKGLQIDHYIVKPIKFNLLFLAIDACLGSVAPL
jgi:two-component system response regulator SaeR